MAPLLQLSFTLAIKDMEADGQGFAQISLHKANDEQLLSSLTRSLVNRNQTGVRLSTITREQMVLLIERVEQTLDTSQADFRFVVEYDAERLRFGFHQLTVEEYQNYRKVAISNSTAATIVESVIASMV